MYLDEYKSSPPAWGYRRNSAGDARSCNTYMKSVDAWVRENIMRACRDVRRGRENSFMMTVGLGRDG